MKDLYFSYAVTASFADPTVAPEWIGWMEKEHLADVISAGALSGTVIALDDGRAEARYEFADRAAYDRYLVDHAPRLRALGIALFPTERGITYERRAGPTISQQP